jgi:fibronectin type 3 domain-containing protein
MSLDHTGSGDITTFTDSGLMNGQTFYYAVCAVNSVGDGPKTPVVEATPLALPDAPGDLVAVAGNGTVTISWLRPMNNGGTEVTQYRIYRGATENDLELITTKGKSVFIYDDSEVVVGTTYHYAIAAITVAGEGPLSIIASSTPYGPPGIPISLTAVPGNREVRLTWSPPEDDGASPIEGYVILRGTSVSSLRELAQLGDVTSYLDTSVSNDQTYYYTIAAINKAGPGDHTDIVNVTRLPQVTAPDKVATLVTDVKGAKVTLQWTAPQDNGGSPVTSYVILRGLSKDSLEQIAEVGPGVTTWSEEGLERGTTYFYSVAAKNDVGEGEPILAREVKVEKKKDEGPGFEVLAVVIAMMLVIPMIRRRG